MKHISLFLILSLLFTISINAQNDYNELVKLFDYDQTQSLDLQITQTDIDSKLNVKINDVNYVSPVEGRVTALMVEPLKIDPDKKYAGIIFLHWGQGDRSEFVWEAALYANAGAISITLDAPWNRPEPWKQPGEDFNNPEQSKQMYIQNIKDLRRAVDLLIESGRVDPERIAYVGHSFGATQGGVFAGVEKRVKTFVLMGGLPSIVDKNLRGARKFDNLQDLIEKYIDAEKWKEYSDMISPLTPTYFIGYTAPSSIFMQFGKYDSWISERAAEIYYTAASKPKEMKWYLTSHEFTDLGALVDRAEWLKNEVGIDSIINLLEMYLQ